MKKTILLVLALVLVSGFVYAANVSGKLEAKAQIGFGEANQPFANNGVFTFEPNITGAVDEYNSVTIELRLLGGEVIETNSRGGSTTDNLKVAPAPDVIIQAGSFFINSDIAGALGWTESTGGLNFKLKAGYFGPGTTEVGQIKDIVESSDTADLTDLVGLADGGASEFTIGYTDYINVLIGLKYGDDGNSTANNTIDRFGWFFNPYGKAVLGPGTLEYSLYFGANHYSDEEIEAETNDQGAVGVGIEYNNIALGGDLSLGIGGEFSYALTETDRAPHRAAGVDLEDVNRFNYGANVVLDVSNWLDVDLAVGGNQDNILNEIGIGLGVNDPSETVGLVIETQIKLANETENDLAKFAGATEDLEDVIRINPDLWFKAGAAKFTVGIDIVDINDFDQTLVDLIVSLSF